MDNASHLSQLPPKQRLALAYATRSARPALLGMMALDARLAGIVRFSREPLLAQLRLAWWRDRLLAPRHERPEGEPLLHLLDAWGEHRAALAKLVDGWEVLLGEAPLGQTALAEFAAGRGAACAALAHCLGAAGDADQAERAGRNWGWADLAARVSHPAERAAAVAGLAASDLRRPAMSRALRPLAILHALAKRSQPATGLAAGPGSIFIALRVGLLGI